MVFRWRERIKFRINNGRKDYEILIVYPRRVLESKRSRVHPFFFPKRALLPSTQNGDHETTQRRSLTRSRRKGEKPSTFPEIGWGVAGRMEWMGEGSECAALRQNGVVALFGVPISFGGVPVPHRFATLHGA